MASTLPQARGLVEIASAESFLCARHRRGTVSCWGDASNGPFEPTAPVSNATGLAAQFQTMCAIDAGKAACWGVGGAEIQAAFATTTDIRRIALVAPAGGYSLRACVLTGAGVVRCQDDIDTSLPAAWGTIVDIATSSPLSAQPGLSMRTSEGIVVRRSSYDSVYLPFGSRGGATAMSGADSIGIGAALRP